jgi:hypothetical protein
MSTHPSEKDKRSGEATPPHDDGKRSGEGADTALEALIRQRKLAEGPDPADTVPPAPPA